MKPNKISVFFKHPIYAFVYVSFAFFVVLPIIYTLAGIFFADSSLINSIRLLDKSIFLLLAKSALIAFFIAFVATMFGTILSLLLYKTKFRFRSFFKIALLIPLFVSPYILAVAWKDFFHLFFNNSSILSSGFGIVLVLSFVFTPLSMLIVGSALSNINSQLEESAIVITGLYRVVFKVTLPLVKPALISSFVLIFIFSISEFSVPAFFSVKVFTTEIFTQFSAFYKHSLAILQSAMLVAICLLLLYADRKHLTDAPFFSVGSSGTSSGFYFVESGKIISIFILSFWFFVSVVLPFAVLTIQAFTNGINSFIKAFYLLKPTFITSIWLAFFASLITVVIGFVAAYVFEIKKKKTLYILLLFVFAVPSIIFGISLIKFYNHPVFETIYSGFTIIIIAYVGKFSFISAKIIGNSIKQIPQSLDESAQIAGVGFYKRLQKILIPLIMPAIFAAFIINFIFFIGELGATIMVYPPGAEIMPIKVFTIMANAPQSLTSSMVLIVFSVTLLIIVFLHFISKILGFYHNLKPKI